MKEDSSYQEIREILHKSGWLSEDTLFEPMIYLHDKAYHPDIVLLYNLFPLAVIEIKRDIITPELVIVEAREQAKTLGIPFALLVDRTKVLEINAQSGDSRILADFPTAKDLWTALGRVWLPNDPRLYPPYLQDRKVPRFHQIIAVTQVLEAIMDGKRRVLLAMAVGTGKAWVLFQIAWKLIQSRHCHRILYLFDRVSSLEQTRESFKHLDQNLLVLSKVHLPTASARIHIATISQLQTSEMSNHLLSLPSDFYDLIFLESVHHEKSLHPILDHFSTAIQISLKDPITSTVSQEYASPVFTYTLHDAIQTEHAYPPIGFIDRRMGEIAEVHSGKRRKDTSDGFSTTTTQFNHYLVTSKSLLADGTLQLDAKNIVAENGMDEHFTLKQGDILLPNITTGEQINIILVSKELPGVAIFDYSLIRIRVTQQSVDPQAVLTFLQSDSGQRKLRTLTYGSIVLRLSAQAIADMRVFLPEAAEIENEAIELSAAARAIQEIRDQILPRLEDAEKEREQNTANAESAPNLRAAAERLRELASSLVPPSLSERVTIEYPTPIALAYRRFQDAQFDIYQQLLRLRDIFEATSYYIYHVVLADILQNLDSQKYFVKDRGTRRAYNGYSMAARLDFVSAILEIASSNDGQDLFMPEVVELASALDLAKHIQNDFRNHLSHTTTAQEGIVERTLKTFKPAVEQLLEQTAFLTRYPLVRVSSFSVKQGCWVRRMMVYKGVAPYLKEETLSMRSILPSAESDHLILLSNEDKVLDLYPLYQLLTNEETRFEPHICILKQRKQSEKRLEGESLQGAFEIQLDGFDTLEQLQKRILDNL